MVIGVWVSALGTHSQIKNLPQPGPEDRFSPRSMLGDMSKAFSIPSFTAIVTASIVAGMSMGMVQALIIYTGTYFFELSPNQMSFLFTGGVVGVVTGTLLTRPSRLFLKKKNNSTSQATAGTQSSPPTSLFFGCWTCYRQIATRSLPLFTSSVELFQGSVLEQLYHSRPA